MKAMIIGSNGQLGFELARTCPETHVFLGLDVPQIDITDSDSVTAAMASHKPDWVINCAAYTQVDKAESDQACAHAVNCDGPANLAREAKNQGIRLLHVSTDFVFSGTSCLPYLPDDPPDPQSIYGKTKLAGEQAVRQIFGPETLIIRTAWLYAGHGGNFVKTMIRLMKEKEFLTVIDDQIGTPCWARGLARVIWAAVEKNLKGIFHWTDAGVASWYDFAVAIQEEALAAGLLKKAIPIIPVPTEQYPTPAPRPPFSVLDKRHLTAAIQTQPQHWRVQLRNMLKEQ